MYCHSISEDITDNFLVKEPPMDQRYMIFMRRMEKIKLSFVCCGSIYSGMQEGKSAKVIKINV